MDITLQEFVLELSQPVLIDNQSAIELFYHFKNGNAVIWQKRSVILLNGVNRGRKIVCFNGTCPDNVEGYYQNGRVDVNLFRDKLVDWYKNGSNSVNGRCFDIGCTTRFALEQYIEHGATWFGNAERNTAGNAAIIRQDPAI